MSVIGAVASWVDSATLAVTRLDEASKALGTLAKNADASDEVTMAVRNGGNWDDPFDAVLSMSDLGNSGMYDAWSAVSAADSLMVRAIRNHPGGAGSPALAKASDAATSARSAVENWIVGGGDTAISSLADQVGIQHMHASLATSTAKHSLAAL